MTLDGREFHSDMEERIKKRISGQMILYTCMATTCSTTTT